MRVSYDKDDVDGGSETLEMQLWTMRDDQDNFIMSASEVPLVEKYEVFLPKEVFNEDFGVKNANLTRA